MPKEGGQRPITASAAKVGLRPLRTFLSAVAFGSPGGSAANGAFGDAELSFDHQALTLEIDAKPWKAKI